RGYEYMKQLGGELPEFALKPADSSSKRLFMMGNEAVGLGALAAGVRVMPAYPITPASDIMEYLIRKFPQVGGVVVQTEDEIAAINMAIGAAFGGARAMTATSGPGLSLMMEAIGLSGMTETPVVIVDTQRGGPSTGLPTKQEQSDLYAALFGTHGEIPKIVLNPATTEECFYAIPRAFNLAEYYQCPVIVMTDLQLSLSKQSTDPLSLEGVTIDRGLLASPDDLVPTPQTQEFKRYRLTDSGISPRVFPGTPGGIHKVTGVEHAESGRPNETSPNRKVQMEKRMRKLQGVELEGSVVRTGDAQPDVLLVGMGANLGVIEEAATRLRAEGVTVGHAHVHAILPFPRRQLSDALAGAKKVIVVENNATAQLRHLMAHFGVEADNVSSLLKYDGSPFLPKEIYQHVKELF
ncbi:MAG: 2-oxoacid:acceptor oxidoreductase subunit alpha, partial [Alicyclobacillus sp.]|nr:2-oxoacid:acceptor oxidoreductase subunit alpha [Alicyclobacillus sp.]